MKNQGKIGDGLPEKVKDKFEHYWQYARLWRTWVVGIAVAALFVLLHEDIGAEFSRRARIAVLFLVAGGLQVILAWVNKVCAYYEYCRVELEEGATASDRRLSCWARFWCWLSDQYWVGRLLHGVRLASPLTSCIGHPIVLTHEERQHGGSPTGAGHGRSGKD